MAKVVAIGQGRKREILHRRGAVEQEGSSQPGLATESAGDGGAGSAAENGHDRSSAFLPTPGERDWTSKRCRVIVRRRGRSHTRRWRLRGSRASVRREMVST